MYLGVTLLKEFERISHPSLFRSLIVLVNEPIEWDIDRPLTLDLITENKDARSRTTTGVK
jgi:hypothetical protein